jgi:hypothetical protein
MENEFLPYELAVEMKSIGFDEPCLGYFASKDAKTIRLALWTHIGYVNANRLDDDLVTAPIYQQAFRWFREKYGYYYEIFVDDDKTFGFMISYFIEIGRADKPIQRMYTTYEEAELECLKKLIEIIKTP